VQVMNDLRISGGVAQTPPVFSEQDQSVNSASFLFLSFFP